MDVQAKSPKTKQDVVCGVIHWLLLHKARTKPTSRIKADLSMAIICARNVLRKQLNDSQFNLRREFVINSLSRDDRFILPPTRGKGFQFVSLASSFEGLASIKVDGMNVSYLELINIVFEIEDKTMCEEVRQEITKFAAAA